MRLPDIKLTFAAAAFAASLFALPAAAQTVQPSIAVGSAAQAIAINPVTNKIYVANDASNDITVIDGSNHTTTTIPVGNRPFWIAANPETNRIYVGLFGDSATVFINGSTGAVSGPMPTGGVGWTTINPVTNKVYNLRYGGADEFNIITNDVYQNTSATFSFQPVSIVINPVTNVLYIAHAATGDVTAQDMTNDVPYPPLLCPNGSGGFKAQPIPEGGHQGACIDVAGTPVALAVNPVTNKIYSVSTGTSGQISVINGFGQTNPHTFTALTPEGVTGDARAVAVNPVTNKIYAAFSTHIVVVNGADNAMTVIPAPGGPVAVGVNAMTNKIYVPNADGTLTVIDGATNATSSLEIPAGAKAIAVNPITNTMYVLNAASVTPIDGAAGDTTQNIPLKANITALPDNASGPSGNITITASSTFTPAALAQVRKVYYQIDSTEGPWVAASGSGPFTASFAGLSNGPHTIHAFATNGLDAPSIMTDVQNNPLVGNIASYAFTVGSSKPVNPSISLASSQNPSTVGSSVTFTASVSGSAGTATGTVTFRNGGTAISGCASVALSSGAAACTTSALSVGTHSIVAQYSGSSAYNGGNSAPVSQVVEAESTEPGVNFAAASNGGSATASSDGGGSFPVSSLVNGDRAGLNWGAGGGWKDGTANVYPDWVQINFDGTKEVSRVVVFSLQDNPMNPVQPSDTTTFASFGATAFTVEGWTGSAWVTLATVTGNNLVKRAVNFTPFATDRIRVNINATPSNYSRLVEIEAYGAGGSTSINAALASNGASASGSSDGGSAFPVASLINGDRKGLNWGAGGGWKDGTANAYPDWVQVNFGSAQEIERVVLYSLQDNPMSPVEPGDGMTFASFGATSFTVEAWNGSAWVAVASVTGNNLVKRTVTFSPVTTDRIRVNVNATPSNYSRLVEIEAWTVGSSAGTNVAAASAGATASESSTGGSAFPVGSVINGDRKGLNWGEGGGWKDGTANAYPDWVQIDFSGTKTINKVVVYSIQDNAMNPAEPTDSATFSAFGATSFTVEGWNGSAWVTLGTVTGNNLVKRTVTFEPFATSRIRVNVNATPSNYSRLAEIEAFEG